MIAYRRYLVTLERPGASARSEIVESRAMAGDGEAVLPAEALNPGWTAVAVGRVISGRCGWCRAPVLHGDDSRRCENCTGPIVPNTLPDLAAVDAEEIDQRIAFYRHELQALRAQKGIAACREAVYDYLSQQGPASVKRISAAIDAKPSVVRSALEHTWFTRTKGVYSIARVGDLER